MNFNGTKINLNAVNESTKNKNVILESIIDETQVQDWEQLYGILTIKSIEPLLQKRFPGSLEKITEFVAEKCKKPLMNFQTKKRVAYATGALEPKKLLRESKKSIKDTESYFNGVMNFSNLMTKVKDQGLRGTCTAFAFTACNEKLFSSLRGSMQDLSEQSIYFSSKKIEGDNLCGTYLESSASALRDTGQCKESFWGYDMESKCEVLGIPPIMWKSDAELNKREFVKISHSVLKTIINNLREEKPVVISVAVYDSSWKSKETERSGRITMPLNGENYSGGHAICLVGFNTEDDDPRNHYFIFKNSWGTDWANESPYGAGYGTIQLDYVLNYYWEVYAPK